MMSFKYLHEPTHGTLILDHRLTPEVRAMLAAMVSRSPVGGMKQRYAEVVEAVAAELWPGSRPLPYMRGYKWAEAKTVADDLSVVAQVQYVGGEAENRLCEYPLHAKVQGFFDQFVGQYGHCYDGQTDVLARVNGRTSWYPWPKFCDFHTRGAEVEVAAFDPTRDGVLFEKPLVVIRKPYSGKMYRVGKQRGNIDLFVTPEHTMLVRKRMYVGGGREAAAYEWSDWCGVRAEEVAGKTTYRYKRGASRNLSVTVIPPEADPWGFGKKDMHAFGRLCGFFVGDGYAGGRQSSYLSFNLRKNRELTYLADLVHALNLNVIDGGNGCQHVSLTGARKWALTHFYAPEAERTHKKGWDTRIPEWVMHAPEAFVLGFLDGMRNSDGSDITGTSWSLSSVSSQVMEAVQVLGTMWGCPVSVRGPYSDNEVRTAFVSGPKCREPVINRNGSEDGWEDYEGEVFCATTSTGFLVVRRNYATVVSGNSSVMELTGSPTVAVEGVSWFTAWLLFDSPLVAGQEFSTRAVRRTDWPMARECIGADSDPDMLVIDMGSDRRPHPGLAHLHEEWMRVFEAEVTWWTEHLSDPKNRAALGIADKEPFRPALDRARWALPGTFATGAAFASNVRERARTIRDATAVNRDPAGPTSVWSDIEAAYRVAAPGIAQYGLKEAVVTGDRDLPGHLTSILQPVRGAVHPSGVDVDLRVCEWKNDGIVNPYTRTKDRSYADPWFNRQVRAQVRIECSLAVARDWHRHRTLYPWHLGVVYRDGTLCIDRRYEPKSDVAIARTPDLLKRSHVLYRQFLDHGDVERAALALPMGTRVVVSGAGGLRDVLYMLELRATTHGANFEYKEQAEAALYLLEVRARLATLSPPDAVDTDLSVFDSVGYRPTKKVGASR